MKITEKLDLKNCDNMDLMREFPDNHFDLAIVDPPYGIGAAKQLYKGTSNDVNLKHTKKNWDNETPTKEYFDELFRVSKKQIIWGGNYFLDNLNSTRCFLIWDKQNGANDMADGELAWTSFDSSVRIYKGHIFKGIGCTKYKPIHPTQKPILLYEWILMNYAKEGDKILDTHLGSMSIALACHNLGFDLTGCELDSEYYEQGIKRVKNHIKQLRLF